MLISKKNLPNSRILLTVGAAAAEFQQAFDQSLAEISQKVKLPGFRPGKAPKGQVIEKVSRGAVEAEALEKVVSEAYSQVLQSEKLVPVESPHIHITEFTAPAEDAPADQSVLTFTAEVDVVPEVNIKGYEKIRIKKSEPTPPKEEEVERVIEYLRKQRANIKEATPEATLHEGMWVDLAYQGSIGGVSRPDMTNKNHPLVLGEGQLIPGFEEQIIGMKTGESRKIQVTFPKDYHAKELAGKKAEFKVSINELKNVELPPLNEEFAKAFGHPDMATLKKAILQNLVDEKRQLSEQEMQEKVLEELLKVAKFEVPLSLVEQELGRMFEQSKDDLAKMNFNWDEYLTQTGKTMEQLKEEMRPQAEKNVRLGLSLGKVIQEEGITKVGENAGQTAIEHLIKKATI